MTDPTSLLPPGISHEPDLASLPEAEQMKYFRRCIQQILPEQGRDGVAEFVAMFPKAAAVRTRSLHRAYLPKPPGYIDALANMVSLWFDSSTALEQSNKADVERLNAKLGTSFPPANHFNMRLSAGARKRLAEVFKRHRAHFDTTRVDTLSKVRKAVRAAKEAAQPDTIAFGSIGHRTQHTLSIGAQAFIIERNGPRECIRPRIGGSKRRLYLEDILWLADVLTQDVSGDASPHSLRSKLIERAYLPQIAPDTASTCASLETSSESLVLSDRIRNLAAPRSTPEPAQPRPHGADPLALI